MPENEYVTMRIAEAFCIITVKSSLIRLKSGELSCITRRINSTKEGEKIYMLDMYQIMEAYDKYKNTIKKIGRAFNEYSNNTFNTLLD